MKPRRRDMSPMIRLAFAFGKAAHHIANPQMLAIAIREVHAIPRTPAEIGQGRKREMARLGRRTIDTLPTAKPEQFADLQSVLRGCRDAILSRFEVTSEVSLGDRRRRSG